MTRLTDLGLSSYEAQAYRALLATGPAPARTVVDRSEVPEGRIYDVLDGLESRGLVRSTAGEPRRYEPVDPEDAIDRLLASRLEELDAEADRYRALAAEARSTLAPTPPTAGHVWLSAFEDADALALIEEMLATVEDRFVMAVGAPYAGAALADYRREVEAFADALPTDAAVDVLLDAELVDPLLAHIDGLDAAEGVSVRQLPAVDVTVEVVDGAAAYVDLVHPFATGRRLGFVEIREAEVASDLEALFDEAWARAEPVV